jgi:hypothetical protein
MAFLCEISEYEVMYSANGFVPRMWLKGAGKILGQLIFQPNGSILPADNMVDDRVSLYYHLDDFQNVIDLLRNERPIYLLYSGSGGGFENGIKTTAEAVGEGEI